MVDKIEEFAAELAGPATDPEEQVVALKFLLHFVGDLHQPLHSSDDNDGGGNSKKVSAAGFRAGSLHHFWDTEFVDQLETDPKSIASDLIGHISRDQISSWQAGSPSDWAMESFKVAKDGCVWTASRAIGARQLSPVGRIRDDRYCRCGRAIEQRRRAPCIRPEQGAWRALNHPTSGYERSARPSTSRPSSVMT